MGLRSKQNRQGTLVSGLQWMAGCAVLLGLWQGAVWALDIAPFTLPSPWRIGARLSEDAGLLAHHGLITLTEIVVGLIAGTLAGIATALVMAVSRFGEKLIWPLVVITQALPVFAIAPLLVQWFGFGMASKIVMAGLIIYFPVASATYDGLTRTDSDLLDLGKLWGGSRFDLLRYIRFPAALPSIASGVRIAAAIAPIGAVVGEWVGSSAGLGYLMLHANARLQTDLVFAALAVLAAIALFTRFLAGRVTRRLVFWAPEHDLHRL